MATRYYTWQAPGKPVLVSLSLSVVDRIVQEAFRGLGALPRRGAEVGGILLGAAQRGDQVVVKIVDCVPVICGHYFGPSYVLTQDEKQGFQQLLARWRPLPSRSVYAVGYYRSHTRDELFLSDDDVWLMSTYFADPSRVALLVKPRVTAASVGGFFFWEGGRIRGESSYAEFPFDPVALSAAAAEPSAGTPVGAAAPVALAASPPVAEPPVPAPPPASEAAAPVPEKPSPAPAPSPPPRPEAAAPVQPGPSPAPPPRAPEPELEPLTLPSFLRSLPPRKESGRRPSLKIPWQWIPVCLLLVLLGGWLGTQGANYLSLGAPRTANTEAYALRLTVVEYGDNLHLRWDRRAPALSQAERGILIIGDGDQTRTLELDGAQLRSGSVIYRRVSGPVRFRLELYLKGNRSLSEAWEPPLAGTPRAQQQRPGKEAPSAVTARSGP